MSTLLYYYHIISRQASYYIITILLGLEIDKAGGKVLLSDNYQVNLTATCYLEDKEEK